MKSIYKILCGATLMLGMALTSCTKAEVDTTDKNALHTCTMTLVGSINEFDQTPGTKAGAGTTEWKDGSVIYLRMASPMGATTGKATYKMSTDVWTLEYYGSLYEGAASSCTAVYVEDEKSVDGHVITLTENTAIFEDTAGSYLFKGDDLVVTANLKPRTGRIRFQGVAGTEMRVYGLNHYTTFDNGTNLFQKSSEVISISVASDGFTPYIYAEFFDSEEPTISVWIDAKDAYTRYCSNNVIKVGESGKMTIPTDESHPGWAKGIIIKANSYYYTLLPVEGGTFTMGNPDSSSSEYTAHNVTLTGFCIGETEITLGLYGVSTNYPKHPFVASGSFEKTGTLATNIFKSCGILFDYPTEAQWEFAARGGNKSKGYNYSGGDNYNDVATSLSSSYWDYYSYYSDVKTKLPNELGLYDMTGNAYEYVVDYYAAFTSAPATNPVCTKGNGYHVYKSGDPVYYRSYYSSSSFYKSSRFVLNW